MVGIREGSPVLYPRLWRRWFFASNCLQSLSFETEEVYPYFHGREEQHLEPNGLVKVLTQANDDGTELGGDLCLSYLSQMDI